MKPKIICLYFLIALSSLVLAQNRTDRYRPLKLGEGIKFAIGDYIIVAKVIGSKEKPRMAITVLSSKKAKIKPMPPQKNIEKKTVTYTLIKGKINSNRWENDNIVEIKSPLGSVWVNEETHWNKNNNRLIIISGKIAQDKDKFNGSISYGAKGLQIVFKSGSCSLILPSKIQIFFHNSGQKFGLQYSIIYTTDDFGALESHIHYLEFRKEKIKDVDDGES